MLSPFAPVLIAGVLSSASVAAVAQPASAPSTAVSPLTVEAAPDKVIEKQVHSFVLSYAAVPNPEIDQIGRWHAPVCVEVVGLPLADQAAQIKARIESVAQSVGLRAAGAGCRANVEIVFAVQPQRVMDMVAQRREYILGYYHRHDRDRLKTVTHPIQSWYVSSTSNTGGDIAALVSAGIPVQPHTGVIDDPDNVPPPGCASRFSECYTSAFENVFVAADSKILNGKDLNLVADYMVMLVLSQSRSLDGCNALPSVIDVFAKTACPGRDAPNGLTAADAAYLTALYASDPQAKKPFEQSDIARRMAEILIKADAAARAGAGSPAADAKAR